jgi:hypothetical protein
MSEQRTKARTKLRRDGIAKAARRDRGKPRPIADRAGSAVHDVVLVICGDEFGEGSPGAASIVQPPDL